MTKYQSTVITNVRHVYPDRQIMWLRDKHNQTSSVLFQH